MLLVPWYIIKAYIVFGVSLDHCTPLAYHLVEESGHPCLSKAAMIKSENKLGVLINRDGESHEHSLVLFDGKKLLSMPVRLPPTLRKIREATTKMSMIASRVLSMVDTRSQSVAWWHIKKTEKGTQVIADLCLTTFKVKF